MGKLFTQEFFKFLLAFSLIIVSSFAFMLAVGYHQASETENTLTAEENTVE